MKKKVVLIIGGASGIGFSTTKYLSEKNYMAVIADKAAYGNSKHNNINYIKTDILFEKSVKSCMQKIKNDFNRLDGLIYTVGVSSKPGSIVDFKKDTWENIFNTNVTGALLCLKYAYPILKKSQGRVVIIGTVATHIATRLSGFEYTISKTALSGLVRQLAIDWAKDNILINSVHPSMTSTPMLLNNISSEKIKEVENKIPMGRIAEPKEIARAIEFLVSNENTYITGSCIDINGGLYLNG